MSTIPPEQMPTPPATSATGPPGAPAPEPPPPTPPGQTPPPGADQLEGPDPGIETTYYCFRVGGPEGRPVGVFRVAKDDEEQLLVMERFSPDGTWEEDSTLIDDIREPGVYECDEAEAESIQAEIMASAPEPPAEEPAPGAPAPPRPAPPRQTGY